MPFQLIRNDLSIDFLGRWKWAAAFSAATLLAGLIAYFPLGGFRYGIDFLGGTLVQVKFAQAHDLGEVRRTLQSANLGPFELQAYGEEGANEVLITMGPQGEQESIGGKSLGERVEEALSGGFPGLEVRRVETVGPKVGQELKLAAWYAIAFAVVAIMLYVWFRFEWRYGISALVATAHDVLFVLAAFIFLRHEITLPVVASVLTVAGYSINDTIVIMDRIRDNRRRFQKAPQWEIINNSVNQTLSRTLLTSGTTLLTVIALFAFGGEIIRDFSLALLIGIVIGTYSSIYVASPLLILMERWFPHRAR
jgi:preprotein translocase subunit SecF